MQIGFSIGLLIVGAHGYDIAVLPAKDVASTRRNLLNSSLLTFFVESSSRPGLYVASYIEFDAVRGQSRPDVILSTKNGKSDLFNSIMMHCEVHVICINWS